MNSNLLSARAFNRIAAANSWEEIWEAGPYYDRVSELLEDATEYAIFVGWQIDSRLCLKRPLRKGQSFQALPKETLREKVIRLCQEKPGFRVYFLIWDHAYFYVLEREIWQGRIWEDIHPRVHFIFDNKHPIGGSHHEKICLFDGKTALCGGIDLCDERWDSPQHLYMDPRRSLNWSGEHHGPYHDLAVQVTGPICAGIHDHIAARWRALSSISFPDSYSFKVLSSDSIGHSVYLSRTIAQVEHPLRGSSMVREVEFLFRDLIQAAENRIILEGQYYWSQIVNDLLISKIHQMKGKDFEIILVLADLQPIRSWTRYMMAYELELLNKLQIAANYSGIKLIMGFPYARAPLAEISLPPRPIYIHSKIIVIDDKFLGIGSANFASRALRIDTEIHLTFEAKTVFERSHIRRVAEKVLSHWNLDQNGARSGILFRECKPKIMLEHMSKKLEYFRGLPWEIFFDPPLPWFYFIKWKGTRLARRHFLFLVDALMLVWGLEIVIAWSVTGVLKGWGDWSVLYIIFMSSVWLLPVPFIFLEVLAMLHLGPDRAARISVASFWVASFVGYSLVRAFPISAARFYREAAPKWLSERMGLRKFSTLVSMLSDPRVSIRSKIAYQGLFWVPFPWYLLGTVIFFSAVLYILPFWFYLGVHYIIPLLILEPIKRNAGYIFVIIFLMSVGRIVIKLWKNYG